MAELKLRNEIGLNRSLAVLEPARRCVGRCTWCYVEINRRSQWGDKERSDDDAGSFERLVERAFGPAYDPTDLIQWQLHNKVPFVWSSGVEPFQDLAQARAILSVVQQVDLPVFVQTRGTHWREVWDLIEPRAGDIGFYVSVPSLDPAYVRRFEPQTPAIAERETLVRACAAAGIPAMVAVAPYHPSWSPDLPGMTRAFAAWGATDLFLDKLHLNRTQAATIRDHGGDRKLLELAKSAWDPRTADQWADAALVCAAEGMGFATATPEALIHELAPFPATDPWPYATAFRWPYAIADVFGLLAEAHAGLPDPGGPILLDWSHACRAMEAAGDPVDQAFSFRSMSQFRAVRDLSPAWKEVLGAAAPFRDYLRALWNAAKGGGFPWFHPFARYAVRPDGQPHRGAGGDLVMVYDPDWPGKSPGRVLGSLDDLPWYEIED